MFSLWPVPARDELSLNGISLSYDIRVSRRRRTLCIQLFPDGRTRVSVPAQARLSDIRAFVHKRFDWIQYKQKQLQANRPVSQSVYLQDGMALPLLGESLILRSHILPKAKPKIQRCGLELQLTTATQSEIYPVLEHWYRQQALQHAQQRIAHYAPQVGLMPGRVVIRGQKTRWGSCSARGTLSLNWRLMQLRSMLMDYVVVHELCHLLHANHSACFWREVERILPDYLHRRRVLHTEGRVLAL